MDYKEYTVRIYSNGTKNWLFNDLLHREDGPAIEVKNGTKYWYLNDRLHREDGPAIEGFNGAKEWYFNGKLLTEKEFLAKTNKDACEGKVVEIDGKKYKLSAV